MMTKFSHPQIRNKLLVLICLLGCGMFVLSKQHPLTQQGRTMNLRVAFPAKNPVEQYEPTRILLAPEYIFLETIYSPLVEF